MNNESSEVKLHFLDYWRVIRVRLGIVFLAFFLVVVTAGVVTWLSPKKYRSVATMEVKSEMSNVRIFDASKTEMGADPRFTATQFEIIQRTEILYPVIEALKLHEKWATGTTPLTMQQAFYRLRRDLDLKAVRNTDLIEVIVLAETPQLAADISNTIASVYEKTRIDEQTALYDRAMDSLQEELNRQELKLEEATQEVNRIAQEQNITDLASQSEAEMVDPVNRLVMTQQEEFDSQLRAVEALRTKIEQIQTLEGDALMRALPTLDIPDDTVRKILPEYQELIALEANLLNSGLGANHPNMRALRAQKAVLDQQLKSQVESIRKSLDINLKIAESTLGVLEKKLGEKQQEQRDSRTLSQEYLEAKNRQVQARRLLDVATMRYQSQMMELTMPRNPVRVWQEAEPEFMPAKPRVALNMALGVLAGLVVGIGLAFFMEYLDTSVKTLDDIEKFLELPVLAVVPKNVGLIHLESPDTPDAEAYRILRTNIEFNRKNVDSNSFTIVSGGPGEGKSTTLANLATICAQGGYNVLLVDADLRRPVQHLHYNIDNSLGLANYLRGEANLEDVVYLTNVDKLALLPSGQLPADAVGILNSQRMSDLIADLKSRYDLVLIDSPPILGLSDAAVLSSEVDGTIIVVQHRRFPRSILERVKKTILNVGGTVIGVVLNNVDIRHDHGYEYYTSYYKYYYGAPTGKRSKARRPELAAKHAAAQGSKATGRSDDY